MRALFKGCGRCATLRAMTCPAESEASESQPPSPLASSIDTPRSGWHSDSRARQATTPGSVCHGAARSGRERTPRGQAGWTAGEDAPQPCTKLKSPYSAKDLTKPGYLCSFSTHGKRARLHGEAAPAALARASGGARSPSEDLLQKLHLDFLEVVRKAGFEHEPFRTRRAVLHSQSVVGQLPCRPPARRSVGDQGRSPCATAAPG